MAVHAHNPKMRYQGLGVFFHTPKSGSLQLTVSLMDAELHSHRRSLVSGAIASECLPPCNDSFKDRKGFCCAEGNGSTKYLAFWFHSKSERSHTAKKHFQITRQPQPKAGQLAGCPGLRNPGVSTAPSLGRSLFQSPASGKPGEAESKARPSQAGTKLGGFCHHPA